MCGFFYHFNNLRFKQPQSLNDFPAAHVVSSFVSSETLKCRLLRWLLGHCMKYRCIRPAAAAPAAPAQLERLRFIHMHQLFRMQYNYLFWIRCCKYRLVDMYEFPSRTCRSCAAWTVTKPPAPAPELEYIWSAPSKTCVCIYIYIYIYIYVIVSLQGSSYMAVLGQGLGWSGNCSQLIFRSWPHGACGHAQRCLEQPHPQPNYYHYY